MPLTAAAVIVGLLSGAWVTWRVETWIDRRIVEKGPASPVGSRRDVLPSHGGSLALSGRAIQRTVRHCPGGRGRAVQSHLDRNGFRYRCFLFYRGCRFYRAGAGDGRLGGQLGTWGGSLLPRRRPTGFLCRTAGPGLHWRDHDGPVAFNRENHRSPVRHVVHRIAADRFCPLCGHGPDAMFSPAFYGIVCGCHRSRRARPLWRMETVGLADCLLRFAVPGVGHGRGALPWRVAGARAARPRVDDFKNTWP